MDSYGQHMFTGAVRAEQDRLGLAKRFEKMYRNRFRDGLDEDTRAFIATRTSFYMATVGETGWPYAQHRGGPPGFLKLIDDTTLGFADYKGNKQFISRGNLSDNDRVSLFLMDYPRQARLKVIGHAHMVDAGDDPNLAAKLATEGEGPVERLTTIRITAFDWNCPKYILPRYTQDEVTALVAPHLASRDAAIETLSNRLRELGEDPAALITPTKEDPT